MDLHNFAFPQDYLSAKMQEIDLRVFSQGKNIRSKLMLAFAADIGLEADSVTELARVGEMVHNATLSHDDVIDQGEMRRGVPSLAKQMGNKKSVLIGDYLLATAMMELCNYNDTRLTHEISWVLKELVDGELLQLDVATAQSCSLENWKNIAHKKTGSLLSWSFVAPAILKGIDEFDVLKSAANKLGEAYQMLDDCIDHNLLHDKKSTQLDFASGIKNYVDIVKNVLPNLDKLSLLSVTQENSRNLAIESIQLLGEVVGVLGYDLIHTSKMIKDILNRESNI
jgi:geranylgeranyl pyrophosphate synthase